MLVVLYFLFARSYKRSREKHRKTDQSTLFMNTSLRTSILVLSSKCSEPGEKPVEEKFPKTLTRKEAANLDTVTRIRVILKIRTGHRKTCMDILKTSMAHRKRSTDISRSNNTINLSSMASSSANSSASSTARHRHSGRNNPPVPGKCTARRSSMGDGNNRSHMGDSNRRRIMEGCNHRPTRSMKQQPCPAKPAPQHSYLSSHQSSQADLDPA